MTTSTATGQATAMPVTTSMVLAIVDEARAKNYRSGVIGMRGHLDRAIADDVRHTDGRTVRIRPAESALAAREVLAEHRDGDWLVIVTDRDHNDLGAGILAHFIWQRLRSPDPWEAVRRRFAATGIDPALTTGPRNRDLAGALLAATPARGWPAAPAGVLTRAHAFGSVASTRLGLDGDATDVLGVLRWACTAGSVAALAALRRDVGDLLADGTLGWIAHRAGTAATPIGVLLARGELADVVPLGIVVHLLTRGDLDDPQAAHQAQLALVRLEPRWGDTIPSHPALAAFGQATDALLTDLVHDKRADDDVRRALERADAILAQLHAGPLARHSLLLTEGLRARLLLLAEALRRAATAPGDVARTDAVETAWAAVGAHRWSDADPSLRPVAAAVRLVRWLALPDRTAEDAPTGGELGALARHHLDDGAWADAAINNASVGVDDPELAAALHAVVTAAHDRRRVQERRFAAALADAPAHTGQGVPSGAGTVWYLERLLTGAVMPLARKTPVLLLVLDGMSAAVGTEILADATGQLGWLEAALPKADQRWRAAGLAVLPSLTEVSRASLLSGRLVRGQQAAERAGYAELTRQGGKIAARLFHKKGVDTTAAGWSVSHEVGEALDDESLQLVTVVLNTIDDALDRSDPAGTNWTAAAVKHLGPLLARAATARRTVVITADHGHVVERRHGTQRSYPDTSSGRSRAVTSPAGEGEVQVSGPRVLTDDHRAILAVDDTLRYGPLKAGYHGGASAAETVVPIAVLVPDEATNRAGLELLAPQEPAWWVAAQQGHGGSADEPIRSAPDPAPKSRAKTVPADAGPTLFDPEPSQPPADVAVAASLGRTVVRSPIYKRQRRMSGRLIVTDEQIARLVDALAAANATRLAPTLAAQALGVAQTRLRGALTQVQQLLNVEGYPVLATEPATGRTVLDLALLGEQFEVPT